MSATDTRITPTPQQRADWDRRFSSVEWTLLPNPPMDAWHQNALDEVLINEMHAGRRGPHIRFWNWSPEETSVIIGRFQSVKNELHLDVVDELGIKISRRITGGGAMLIMPLGMITYTIAAPESLVNGMSFAESYQFFDSWVINSWRELGVDAWYVPLNDITSSGGKIGGAAQARKKGIALHHTTASYEISQTVLTRVLRIGKEKLSDKGVTSAAKRVGPLKDQTSLDRQTIIQHMIDHFRGKYTLHDDDYRPEEMAALEDLVETKFSTRDWIYALP